MRIQQDKEFADLTNNCKAVRQRKRYNPADRRILITRTWIRASTEKKEGRIILIQCGSWSLTPTQQRYATTELECLAIVWAKQKCDFYPRGLPHFDIWTDHRHLVG